MSSLDANTRTQRARQKAIDTDLDAIWIRNTFNIKWLTQFDSVFDNEQCHSLLICKEKAIFFTDSRYINAAYSAAKNINSDIECLQIEGDFILFTLDFLKNNKDLLTSDNTESKIKIAIEDSIMLSEYRKISENISNHYELVETNNFVPNLRSVKDTTEIETLKQAQIITDKAFNHIVDIIKVGMSELDLKEELENKMKELGATDLAFPTIIAAGPNAANPHAQPGNRKVGPGDCVLFDFGASYNGYCSDMTRCIFMGKPDNDSELVRAWEAVVGANEACQAAIKPGVIAKDIQRIADETLAKHGFEGKMGHSLGHGVGVEIHEEPFINHKNSNQLEIGNVVTVEPGVYIADKFGIRLEDYGVITENGYEPFTGITHDMIVVE